MIYDCFTYFNEEEVLKLRLEELGNAVDYFVIMEADSTFTGAPKDINYSKVEGIEKWEHKIIHGTLSFSDEHVTAWDREAAQRDALWFIGEECNEDDIIVFSDVDEIPKPDVIQSFIDKDFKPVQLDVTQYFWNFNWEVMPHCNQGGRPVVSLAKDVTSPQEMRAQVMERIPNAGWHFSFLGYAENNLMRTKIESFSHTEYDEEEFKELEAVKDRVRYGIDPFDRFPLRFKAFGPHLPKSVYLDKMLNQYVMDKIPS